MTACLRVMDNWNLRCQYAGGELPAIATYGIPSVWPHIRDLYLRSGFACRGHTEIIFVIEIANLPATTTPPLVGLTVARSLGSSGVRFSATLGNEVVGIIEAELRSVGDIRTRQFGWADIGNLWVSEEHRRSGIASWLLGIAADWLRLGGIQRLLAYAWPEHKAELAFLTRHGFGELVRTERGWIRE